MIYFALFSFAMSCNVWFSTFLCVYFCLKIVNVKNTLYICLQRNFQKVFPWLFMSAILGSVLVSFLFILNMTEENSSNLGLNISAINMQNNSSFTDIKEKDILYFMILSWTATMILSISASVIVTSLFKHMNQVQQNFGGFRSPNMKIHVQVLRTVISFLFSYIFIFSALTVNLTSRGITWNYLLFLIYDISKGVVSWSLIKGNRNLDKALRNIFSKLHCTNTSNNVG
ncbi:taste receptor type 2 member 10-like [Engystomops pustulosus]|uniref:taste receptor type 2 member 10-like n=1 Tax=Engystomops pustulosus TaxID=76066 RepID=UPI003AFA1573